MNTFLCISEIGWLAISSIATVSAVIVALFLPFSERQKIKNNFHKIIKIEFIENILIIRKS